MESSEPNDLNSVNWKTYAACSAGYLYVLTIGMAVSYTATATMDMRRPGSSIRQITDDEISWIVSLNMLGSVPAIFLGGYFSQKYGIKTVFMLTSILFTLSWIMIASASSVTWIYAGRLISGFCTELYSVAVPSYIIEIAPQNKRGMFSSGLEVFNTLGMFLVMCLGLALRWSWLAISIVILTIVSDVVMLFMPESPQWLIRQSRLGEAANGLKFFRGKDCPYKEEVQGIAETLRNEQPNQPITLQDFKKPMLYKPLLISIALVFFFVASGYVLFFAYTVEVFQRLGGAVQPDIAATILAALQIVAILVGNRINNKYNRRKLYIRSGAATSVMLISLGVYSWLYQPQYYGYTPLIFFAIYVFAFNLGLLPISFVMIQEMVTPEYRNTVMSISSLMLSFFAFTSTKSYYGLRLLVGDNGVYFIYGFLSLFSIPFGYYILPDTLW